MANTKEISRRIKSITNTRKITKAMEMVAAAKMKKAVSAVLKTRTYSNLSWETVLHLAKSSANKQETLHPLLKLRSEIKKVAVILITSNRGMCGAYNSAVISKAKDSAKKYNLDTDFILVGNKGGIIRNQSYNVVADFKKNDLSTRPEDVYPLAKMILDDYQSAHYDKVFIAYTDFINPVKQVPRVKQLLPINIDEEEDYLGVISNDSKVGLSPEYLEAKEEKHLSKGDFVYEYLFEPSPREVLDKMIPKLVEIQLYQAFLESNASEHSARMTAMNQATEAANDMVSELTLFYNKARQASITAEIAEISAGANALAE